MADLDADGHVDLVSGSWPGEIYLFRGGPGRTFAAPEMLRDKTGAIINVGGGVRETDDEIMIIGHAEWSKDAEGGTVVTHGGKTYGGAGKSVSTTGTASAAHLADWDGDGDLDLLIGEIRGTVHVAMNEGDEKKWAFAEPRPLTATKAVPVLDFLKTKEDVKVAGDAGPFTADWDGDGDLDLLVGAGDGSVSLFENAGTRTAPRLAAARELVPKGAGYDAKLTKAPRRGIRAKVCAADWNGDGKLDLLLGDMARQLPDRPEPAPEAKAEEAKLRAELDELQERLAAIVTALHGPARKPLAKEERAAREKELEALQGRMRPLWEKLPRDEEIHGWVWLFVRK